MLKVFVEKDIVEVFFEKDAFSAKFRRDYTQPLPRARFMENGSKSLIFQVNFNMRPFLKSVRPPEFKY